MKIEIYDKRQSGKTSLALRLKQFLVEEGFSGIISIKGYNEENSRHLNTQPSYSEDFDINYYEKIEIHDIH